MLPWILAPSWDPPGTCLLDLPEMDNEICPRNTRTTRIRAFVTERAGGADCLLGIDYRLLTEIARPGSLIVYSLALIAEDCLSPIA